MRIHVTSRCFFVTVPTSLHLHSFVCFASLLLDGFAPVQGTMEDQREEEGRKEGENSTRHMIEKYIYFIYIMIIQSLGSQPWGFSKTFKLERLGRLSRKV